MRGYETGEIGGQVDLNDLSERGVGLGATPMALFELDHAQHLTWASPGFAELVGTADLWNRSLGDVLGIPDAAWTNGGALISGPKGAELELRLLPRETGWSGLLVERPNDDRLRLAAQAQAILDNVVDAVVTIDTHGRIGSFNRAAQNMFGYAAREIVGRPVTVLMPEPHATRHDEYVRSYLKTGMAQIIGVGRQLEALHKSGRRFPIWLAVSEVTVDGERSFTGIIRDLTDQHAAAQEIARQQDRLARMDRLSTLGEMTAGIAHEVNQPLTAISMYSTAAARLMGADEIDTSRVVDVLSKLAEQALRAGAVIDRIQHFVSTREMEAETVDLNGVIRAALTLGESDVRFHRAAVRTRLADGLPPVRCDVVQIQQVVLNLVRNAIDAMEEIGFANGDQIVIRTELDGGDVRTLVEDRGGGLKLAPEELFAAFRSTKSQGMGMGLAICRTIVGNHGGQLECENQTGGALFWFTLPTVYAEADFDE